MEQARDKIEKLSKHDVVSFTFILSEQGPELMGEETLTTELMGLFEENCIIELAKKIRMRGQALTHRSTRAIKIEQLQEAFSTDLPPTLLPLEDMTDYDLLRLSSMMFSKLKALGRGGRASCFFARFLSGTFLSGSLN